MFTKIVNHKKACNYFYKKFHDRCSQGRKYASGQSPSFMDFSTDFNALKCFIDKKSHLATIFICTSCDVNPIPMYCMSLI